MKTLTIEHPFSLPADDWFHIAPLGEFDHASGVRQVVDGTACRAMVENFAKDAATPNFPGLLVDFDHFSHLADKASAAAGWITDLRAEEDLKSVISDFKTHVSRPDSEISKLEPAAHPKDLSSKISNLETDSHRRDLNSEISNLIPASHLNDLSSEISNLKFTTPKAPGLWAQIRWSDLGEAAVRGGRYRLVSPVWNRCDCEVVSQEENKVRPLRLSRVALTNDPNLKGLVPLTNRTEEKELTMDYKTRLLTLLGLKAEADDATIDAAIANARQEQENLQQRYSALLAERVESDLQEFTAVIGDVEAVRGQLLASRAETLVTLRALRRPVAVEPPAETRPALHNRSSARVPEAVFSTAQSPAEEARARRIANRAREIQKQLGVGHTQAFQLARGEVEKAG